MNKTTKTTKTNNQDMVLEAIENGFQVGNLVVLKDHQGLYLGVDTVNGNVYRVDEEGNIESQFASAETSDKADGYLVAVFNYLDKIVDGVEVYKPYRIKQHILVSLVCHSKEYYSILDETDKPVVCHINSTPWDNRPSNIEWGTTSLNNKQGKMGGSLEHYYSGVYTEALYRPYKTRSGEQANHRLVTLKQGITNGNIKLYEEYNDRLSIPRGSESEYYTLDVVDNFIRFMSQNGYWERKEIA